MSDSNIDIVTAFFDIGRGNLPKEKNGRLIPDYQYRTIGKYFEYFENLAKIKNNLIIYTTKDLEDRVFSIRDKNGLSEKTKVISLDSYFIDNNQYLRDKALDVMNSKEYISKVTNPELIEYWHPDYVLINLFKPSYVVDAINNGYTVNNVSAWIDFGYCRNDSILSPNKIWKYDFDQNKIHLFANKKIDINRDISDIIYTGDVYIQGCHIVAGKEKWQWLKQTMLNKFNNLLDKNLSDDDQTYLLLSYLENPDNFVLRYNSPNDWFRIFKDYNDILDV